MACSVVSAWSLVSLVCSSTHQCLEAHRATFSLLISTMSLRHAGSRFPYRFPPASGMLEKSISGVGSIFRTLGAALDEFGAIMQGSAALKESGARMRCANSPSACSSAH